MREPLRHDATTDRRTPPAEWPPDAKAPALEGRKDAAPPDPTEVAPKRASTRNPRPPGRRASRRSSRTRRNFIDVAFLVGAHRNVPVRARAALDLQLKRLKLGLHILRLGAQLLHVRRERTDRRVRLHLPIMQSLRPRRQLDLPARAGALVAPGSPARADFASRPFSQAWP